MCIRDSSNRVIYHNVGCFDDLFRYYDKRRKFFGLASFLDIYETFKFRKNVFRTSAIISSLEMDVIEVEKHMHSKQSPRRYCMSLPYFKLFDVRTSDTNYSDKEIARIIGRIKSKDHKVQIICMPARHNWPLKGQHLMFHAIKKLKEQNPDIIVLTMEWGSDLKNSKKLVSKLNLENNVYWLPRCSYDDLLKILSVSSVALVEFRDGISGGYGGCVLDCLEAGCPAITQADPITAAITFGSPAPIFHSIDTVEAIYTQLLATLSLDNQARAKVKKHSKIWLQRHCGRESLKQFISMHREVIVDT